MKKSLLFSAMATIAVHHANEARNPTMTENNQQPGSADQARKCELRLCNADDNHAPGCNTYDPERTRDREWDAAPSLPDVAMPEQIGNALKVAKDLAALVGKQDHLIDYSAVARGREVIDAAIASLAAPASTGQDAPVDVFNECTSNSVVLNKSGNLNSKAASLPDVAMPEKIALIEASNALRFVRKYPAMDFIKRDEMLDNAIACVSKALAAQPAEESAQVAKLEQAGWVDQFGNVWPLGAYSTNGKPNYHDAHKRGWQPTYRFVAKSGGTGE